MIEKIVGFKVGEQFFPTIEKAQKHELVRILQAIGNDKSEEAMAAHLLAQRQFVIDVLTMTPTSHPRARKANGANRKPRKAKLDEPDDHKVPPTAEDAPGVTVPGSGKYRGK